MSTLTENAIASRLLEGAITLFAEKGYAATSTREIVEAAGVTKPMLYYYFRSKEGLLAAALSHFIEPFHERMRQVVGNAADARERLVQLVWAHFDFCQQHKNLARLFYALWFGPADQRGQIDLEKFTEKGHLLLLEAVAKAEAEGLIRAGAADEFVMALHGMIQIWIMAALHDDVELTCERADRVVAGLLQGFG